MGIPEENDVRLAGDLAAVAPLPVFDIGEAVERRSDVRLSVQAVKQMQAALTMQKANAVPDPEVLFGYKRTAGFNTVMAGLQQTSRIADAVYREGASDLLRLLDAERIRIQTARSSACPLRKR